MPHVESLHSTLAADPVLGEIVDIFVDEIPFRIETLVSQAAADDWEALGCTAHQLKGAFGSCGFDQLTPQTLLATQRDDLAEHALENAGQSSRLHHL